MPAHRTPSVATPQVATAPTVAAPAVATPETAAVGNSAMQERLPAAAPASTPLTGVQAEKPVTTKAVSQPIRETISNAPDPYGAWNGNFGWDSKFDLVIDPNDHTCTIVMRLFSGADEATKAKWETAIESKWGGRYSLSVAGATPEAAAELYRIDCDLQWTASAGAAHYTVNAQAADSTSDGRSGLGGTSSMTDWGVEDDVDVTHEFGHMLGAPEDYFTTNGVDNTLGGTRRGFRDENGGIMNNPSDDPFTQHYELIRVNAAAALGVDASRCSVR